MRINCYGVFDTKMAVYRWFRFIPTNEAAIRDFGDSVKDSKTQLHAHPEDFSIHLLGSIDDETGLVEPVVPYQVLARGTEFASVSVDNFEKG